MGLVGLYLLGMSYNPRTLSVKDYLQGFEVRFDSTNYCCQVMRAQLTYSCDQHDPGICPDVVIVKGTAELFLVSPNATYCVNFCPWCGEKLE